MKKIILSFVTVFSCLTAFGQTWHNTARFPVKGKQVVIDAQEATLAIEGYDGDDLIIEPDKMAPDAKSQPAPAGFALLSSGYGTKNLNPHYETISTGNLFSIKMHVKVPRNTHLKVIFIIAEPGAKMSFKNLSNELEVEGTAPIIEFSSITGPVTLSEGVNGHRNGGTQKVLISHLIMPKTSIAGNEDIPFLNIITSYGDVDISLPADTKVTVQVDVSHGNLFSDLDLVQQRPAFPMVKNRYTGNLNGGGNMIAINANYGNVFLRRQR